MIIHSYLLLLVYLMIRAWALMCDDNALSVCLLFIN